MGNDGRTIEVEKSRRSLESIKNTQRCPSTPRNTTRQFWMSVQRTQGTQRGKARFSEEAVDQAVTVKKQLKLTARSACTGSMFHAPSQKHALKIKLFADSFQI